jgi:4-hydroxy-4-methyl-2-oxoglutarate aldolase
MTRTEIPLSTIEALSKYDSATVANAIEQFARRDATSGYANLELRCQFPQYEPMVGYAVTARCDSTTPDDLRPQRIGELFEVIASAPKPAVIVVQHLGTDRLKSCFFGDMLAAATQQRFGVVGAVTDAGCRDRSGILRRAPGYQLFCPGWVVAHGHGAFVDFNVDVSICGLSISPGDLLHGDESGLQTIPADIVKQLVTVAQEVRDTEEDFFRFINSDSFSMVELTKRATAHSSE